MDKEEKLSHPYLISQKRPKRKAEPPQWWILDTHVSLLSASVGCPDFFVSDQPDHAFRTDYLRPLQKLLASGIVFQRIKQHLRIQRFFGTSQNAVKSQTWFAR